MNPEAVALFRNIDSNGDGAPDRSQLRAGIADSLEMSSMDVPMVGEFAQVGDNTDTCYWVSGSGSEISL